MVCNKNQLYIGDQSHLEKPMIGGDCQTIIKTHNAHLGSTHWYGVIPFSSCEGRREGRPLFAYSYPNAHTHALSFRVVKPASLFC